jgi:hypothetical protein
MDEATGHTRVHPASIRPTVYLMQPTFSRLFFYMLKKMSDKLFQ